MSPTGNDRTPQDRFFLWSFELPHSGLLPPPLIATTHLLPIIAAVTAATRLLELERVRFPVLLPRKADRGLRYLRERRGRACFMSLGVYFVAPLPLRRDSMAEVGELKRPPPAAQTRRTCLMLPLRRGSKMV